MRSSARLAFLVGGIIVVSCGGSTAAPSASSSPLAVATPSASPARTASPSPAASAPAASGAATPTPRPTLLARVDASTTSVALTKIAIPPLAGKTASIDVMEIDQEAHLLYITDRSDNGIDVFDVATKTAKFLKTIDMGTGSNGFIIVKKLNRAYTGLNDSTIAVIDIDPASPRFHTVVARINTGGKDRTDDVEYDPIHNKIYSDNDREGFVTIVDAATNKVIKKIEGLGAGLQQIHFNPSDGMVYMSGADQNTMYTIDPVKDEIIRRETIAVLCNPNGFAINPKTNVAMLGCSAGRAGSGGTPLTFAWGLAAGKFTGVFGEVGAGDSLIYVAKLDRFYFGAHTFNRDSLLRRLPPSLPNSP